MVFIIPPSASERTTTQNPSRELRVFAAKSDADGGAFKCVYSRGNAAAALIFNAFVVGSLQGVERENRNR
jgi:hypothetical protein